jgi:hypothetical protein
MNNKRKKIKNKKNKKKRSHLQTPLTMGSLDSFHHSGRGASPRALLGGRGPQPRASREYSGPHPRASCFTQDKAQCVFFAPGLFPQL